MFFNIIKKFIFPNRCIVCDEVLPYGFALENEYLCDKCKSKLEFIKEPTCKKCGAMIKEVDGTYCNRCQAKMWDSYSYGFGILRYNEFVKESIHRIKYNGRKEYLGFYGKCIAKIYKNKFKEISPEYLIPVPIHDARLRERNYNQAEVLAEAISRELENYGIDIPVNSELIYRTKNTRVLNKLDNADRGNELKDAFLVSDVSDIEKVIIVDDIYTTGSTINNIAKTLKNAGIKEVYFVAIAIVDNL